MAYTNNANDRRGNNRKKVVTVGSSDSKNRGDVRFAYQDSLSEKGYTYSEWSNLKNSAPLASISKYENDANKYNFEYNKVKPSTIEKYTKSVDTHGLKTGSNLHNIAYSSKTGTRFGVQAQHVSSTIDRIKSLDGNFYGFAVDTEWLGNAPDRITGKGGRVNFGVTELGFSLIKGNNKNGKLSMGIMENVNKEINKNSAKALMSDSISFAMQLNQTTTKDIKGLIDRIREGNKNAIGSTSVINKYTLTNEEFRSLKDLATYADEKIWLTDTGKGVVDRTKAGALDITPSNIHNYLETIEKGLNNLSQGKGSMALPVNNRTYARVNTILQKQFGQTLGNTQMTIMQNKHADVPAIQNLFGGLKNNQFGNVIGRNILYDTMEFERASGLSVLEAGRSRLGKDYFNYFYNGDVTLETLTKTYFNEVLDSWHNAGQDAQATNKIAIEQLTGKHKIFGKVEKATKTSEKILNGDGNTVLTAIGAVKRQYEGDMSYDILEYGNATEYSERKSVDYATTKFKSYKVKNQFEEIGTDNVKYHGIILEDMQGQTMNKITAKTKEELASIIHTNFLATDLNDPKAQKLRNHFDSYKAKEDASRFYRGMYSSSNTKDFDKTYDVLEKLFSLKEFNDDPKLRNALKSNNMNASMRRRFFNLLNEQVNGATGITSNNQIYMSNRIRDNVLEMLPRYYSEFDAMKDFKGNVLNPIDKVGYKNKQALISRAFGEFKNELNEVYESGVEDLKQPKGVLSGRIVNPLTPLGKQEMWVNVANAETLGRSIQGVLRTGLSENMKLVDINNNAIDLVEYLRSEDSVRDLFRDVDGDLDKKLYDKVVKMRTKKGLNPEGLLSNTSYKRILSILEQSKSGNTTKGIQGVGNLIGDSVYDNIIRYNGVAESLGKSIQIEKTLYRNKVSNKIVDANSIFDRVTKYAGSNVFIDDKLQKHFNSIDDAIHSNVYSNIMKQSKNAKQITFGKNATSVSTSFEEMVKLWETKGLNAEFRLSGDGRNLVTTVARANKGMTDLVDLKRAITFNIPLLDTKTGLLDIGGTKKINVINPKYIQGQLTYETYQNKIFKTLSYTKTLEKLAGQLDVGNVNEALGIVQNQIRYTTSGMASGSSHGYKKVKEEITSSSRALNRSRSFHGDLNDLLYSITMNPDAMKGLDYEAKNKIKNISKSNKGYSGINFSEIHLYDKKYKDTSTFLRAVYEEEITHYDREQDGLVKYFRDSVKELNGGVLPLMTALKSEKASEGYVVFQPGDSRFFGFYGHMTSMDSENSRSVLNHRTMDIDEALRIRVKGDDGKYKLENKTRKEYLDLKGFDNSRIDRLFTNYVESEQMNEISQVENITVNLKTAFMTTEQINQRLGDKNIYNIAGAMPEGLEGTKPETKALIDIFGKAHTHEDTMYVSTKVAPLFGSYQTYVKELGKDQTINPELLKAMQDIRDGLETEYIIKSGETKLGEEIGSFGKSKNARNIMYDKAYDALLESIDRTEDGNMIIKMKQFVPGSKEGTKLQGAHAGNKVTARLASESALAEISGVQGVEAIMNISERKLQGLPGDFISSQIGLVMEAATHSMNMQTVGKQTAAEIAQRAKTEVTDYLTNVIYLSNKNKMSKEQALKLVNEHHNISTVNLPSGRTGLSIVGVNETNQNFGINFDILKKETTKALTENKFLSKAGLVNNSQVTHAVSDKGKAILDAAGNPVMLDTTIGNMPFVKTNSAVEYKTSGINGQGAAKVTLRELKYFDSKRDSVGLIDIGNGETKNAIDVVTQHLETTILDEAKSKGALSTSQRAFASLSTTMFDQEGTGKFFTKMGFDNDFLRIGIGNTTDGYLNINDLSSLGDSVTKRRINMSSAKGSILDPEGIAIKEGPTGMTRHKGPVIIELPEAVNIHGKEINNVAFDLGGIASSNIEVMPNNQQKIAAQIIETLKDYSEFQLAPDNEEVAGTSKIKFLAAKKKLGFGGEENGLISRYLTETVNSMTYSKGELLSSISTKKMGASARLQLQGLNPNVSTARALESIGVPLEENTTVVSRHDFDRMLEGLDKDTRNIAMERAETTGEHAFGIRYPSHHESSMQSMKIRVLEEAQEKALEDMGIQMKGNMYLTVGTQMRLKADYDGDHGSIFMPQYQTVDGNVSKENIALVNKAMDKIYERESAISKLVASKAELEVNQMWNLSGMDLNTKSGVNTYEYLTGESAKDYLAKNNYEVINREDVTDDLLKQLTQRAEDGEKIAIQNADETFINPAGKKLVEPNADMINMAEARLGKKAGEFSNVHTKVYRKGVIALDFLAQSDPEAAKRLRVTLEAVGSNIEQVPISSKNVSKMGGTELILKMNDNMETLKNQLINLGEGGSMQTVGGNVIDSMTKLGWIDEDTGEFKGLKNEELVAKAKSDYAGGLYKGKDGKVMVDDIKELFKTIDDFGTKANNFLDIGLGKVESSRKALDMLAAFVQPENEGQVAAGFYEAEYFFRNMVGLSEEEMGVLKNQQMDALRARQAQVMTNVEMVGINSSDGAMNKISTMAQGVRPLISEFESLGAPALKGVGAVTAGLFLAGSMIDGPKISNNVQMGANNKAPATDGTYIEGYNPEMFAGAPIGAEPPQARLIENNKGKYSRVNLNISGKTKSSLEQQEIAQTIADQVGKQLGVQVNLNINSKDTREHLDKRWLEDQFASALTNGSV